MKNIHELPTLDKTLLRRDSHESGADYRARVLKYLAVAYRAPIDAAIGMLADCVPEFPSMQHIHQLQLRRDLLERHSLPFLLAHQAFRPEKPVDVRILAACLAGHTLALTHLDYHLDGAEPEGHRTVTAVKVPAPSAVSYALRMVYRAGALAAETAAPGRLSAEVFDPISGFVISRMHEDWLTRYDVEVLRSAGKAEVQEYLESDRSRILASGYWEVMVRAALIAADVATSDAIVRYCRELRRLRQLVDETDDLEEDLRYGLLTLPTLYRLTACGDDGGLRDDIAKAWANAAATPDGADVAYLAGRVRLPKVGELLHYQAQSILNVGWKAAVEATDAPALLQVLLALKEAKLHSALEAYMPKRAMYAMKHAAVV